MIKAHEELETDLKSIMLSGPLTEVSAPFDFSFGLATELLVSTQKIIDVKNLNK